LLGLFDGVLDGDLDGDLLGDLDGLFDGDLEGDLDGDFEGDLDGDLLGDFDGLLEGDVDGLVEGEAEVQEGFSTKFSMMVSWPVVSPRVLVTIVVLSLRRSLTVAPDRRARQLPLDASSAGVSPQ
jgi:hypothetical protein